MSMLSLNVWFGNDRMLTETELDEIEKRYEAAARGPWMVCITENKEFLIATHVETAVRISAELLPDEMRRRIQEWDVQDEYDYVTICPEAEIGKEEERTLTFVAHSITDVPKLLEELRRLRKENESLKMKSLK